MTRCLAIACALLFSAASARAQEAGAPAEAAAGSAPHEVRVANGVRVGGLLQVDGIAYEQSSVDELDPATRAPRNQERFALSRAWLRLDGNYDYARGLILVEASTLAGPAVSVLAAELSVVYPAASQRPLVELTAGLFFIPFGFETSEYVPRRMFLEASTWVNALFPGRRDLGVRLSGSWSFLSYAIAVMNGNPSLDAAFPLRDPNRAKDVVGRLGASGALARFVSLSGGVSALIGRGFHRGAAPTKDQIVVRDVNEDGLVQPSEIQLIAATPGEASRNFDHHALAADLALDFELPRLGLGRVYGEWVWARNLDRGLFVADPLAAGRSSRELGYMAALRQQLTRHAEFGVRYDVYDPDRDQSRRQGVRIVPSDARFSTLALALAWCTLPRVRVTLVYEHRTNPLGRSASGAPTTLAADSLTLRAQLELSP